MSKASDQSKAFRMKSARMQKGHDEEWIPRVNRRFNHLDPKDMRGNLQPSSYQGRKALLAQFLRAEKVFKEGGDEDKFLWECHLYVTQSALYR